jgi:hypothetical protein
MAFLTRPDVTLQAFTKTAILLSDQQQTVTVEMNKCKCLRLDGLFTR